MYKYKVLLKQAKEKLDEAQRILGEFEGQDLPADKDAEVKAALAASEALKARAEQLKALEERDAELEELLGDGDLEPEPQQKGRPGGGEEKAFGAAYTMRFGEDDKAKTQIMTEVVGSDYKRQIWDQNIAFAKYLRHGERFLEREDVRALTKQIFPFDQIQYLVKNGLSLSQVKATMVEAQGSLGGYAVPPNMQANIVSRLPGRAVVRGLGATVIDLINGTAVDVPLYTGGTSRYRGAIRGAWGGGETATPGEKNATLGTVAVVAQIYTYKVPMSQSLVEDAANLVDLVTNDIASVLAIDEDEAFLIGDGANKPYGILPGGVNALSLTEVVSGAAADLTADGLIGLSDVLDEQYEEGSGYVFNKATGTKIRKLKTGTGEYLFDRDLQNNKRTLLGSPYVRSEAMPDVAANTYSIIKGHFSGYWIVQKFGMTLARFQDSNTGVNKVEFHVRRRVGGRVVETWKFGVQKTAA